MLNKRKSTHKVNAIIILNYVILQNYQYRLSFTSRPKGYTDNSIISREKTKFIASKKVANSFQDLAKHTTHRTGVTFHFPRV